MANEDTGFIWRWLGYVNNPDPDIINDQDELEELESEEQSQLLDKSKKKRAQEQQKAAEESVGLTALILGRFVAVFYGIFVAGLAVLGATFGLLLSMGVPSPLLFAIITSVITAYINVTGFWNAAPKLFDNLFKGQLFKERDEEGKRTDKKISYWRIVGLLFFMFVMSALTAGVAIIRELHFLQHGALQAIGMAGLFGIGIYVIPILGVVGFLTYWVLFSDYGSELFGDKKPSKTLTGALQALFGMEPKDEQDRIAEEDSKQWIKWFPFKRKVDLDLVLPGENIKDVQPWVMNTRTILRAVIFLTLVALFIFATYGAGAIGVGWLLGSMGIAGFVPALFAQTILPIVAMSITATWFMKAGFHFITLFVLGLQYSANQLVAPIDQPVEYSDPLQEPATDQSRITYNLGMFLGTVSGIMPAIFILRTLNALVQWPIEAALLPKHPIAARRASVFFGVVTGLLPAVLILRGFWGFLKAESRYLIEAAKGAVDMAKNGPSFTFHSVFERIRMKTEYKPMSNGWNIAYNAVLGFRNIVWNTVVGAITGFSLVVVGPILRFTGVASVLTGVGIFLEKNRKILAMANAINNGALMTDPSKPAGKNIIQVAAGTTNSAAFGYSETKKETLFGKDGDAEAENVADKEGDDIEPNNSVHSKSSSDSDSGSDDNINKQSKPMVKSTANAPVRNTMRFQDYERQHRLHQPHHYRNQGTYAQLPQRSTHNVNIDRQMQRPAGVKVEELQVLPSQYVERIPSGKSYTGQFRSHIRAQYYIDPMENSERILSSVYTDLTVSDTKARIALAQACVLSAMNLEHRAMNPGQSIIIDGRDYDLVLEAFKVCIKNDIGYEYPQNNPTAHKAFQAAQSISQTSLSSQYKLNFDTIQTASTHKHKNQ